MSILARSPHDTATEHDGSVVLSSTARHALGALRIAFGLTFLWAFADKLLGLGYSTKAADSWLSGGSPPRVS